MTIQIDQLSKRMRSALGNVAEIPAGYARLGLGDHSGRIIADGSKRLAYIYDRQTVSLVKVGQTISLQAINNANMEGVRVRLGYPPYAPGEMHILSLDSGEGLDAVGGALPDEQIISKALYPDVGSILNFRIAPNDPADTSVFVNGSPYRTGSGAWAYLGNSSFDLDTIISALSSGYHQMAVICLDTSAGDLTVVTNTSETGGAGDKQIFDMTTIASLTFAAAYIPIGAVHIYSGQTAVVEDDIYRTADPRTIYAPGISTVEDYTPLILTGWP